MELALTSMTSGSRRRERCVLRCYIARVCRLSVGGDATCPAVCCLTFVYVYASKPTSSWVLKMFEVHKICFRRHSAARSLMMFCPTGRTTFYVCLRLCPVSCASCVYI